MNKILLDKPEQIQELKSRKGLSLIFKHSTRCSISRMALNRMESDTDFINTHIDYYYIDLLKHRDLSNSIAEIFSVEHQSPQILLLKDGNCILHSSHSGIKPSEIVEKITSFK
ncbi:MAG: bacillithiol system redox-active protein YtxJ [Bacteroidetes bacterium]|nr:bacillithiol system redox-active protein YtxJ [Bacteroidota bacterium]